MATEPTETERLLAEEAARERRERRLAGAGHRAGGGARAAERRADKAAYLTEKLREREASEEES